MERIGQSEISRARKDRPAVANYGQLPVQRPSTQRPSSAQGNGGAGGGSIGHSTPSQFSRTHAQRQSTYARANGRTGTPVSQQPLSGFTPGAETQSPSTAQPSGCGAPARTKKPSVSGKSTGCEPSERFPQAPANDATHAPTATTASLVPVLMIPL